MQFFTTEHTLIKKIFLGLSIIACIYCLSIAEYAHAQSRITPGSTSGFFASKVDYISDMAISCAPGEASIDFQLSEYASKTVLSGTPGNWRVFVRDTDGQQISGQSLSGTQKLSDPICFNPNTMKLQVLLDPSNSYRQVQSPAIEPTSDLSSMAGFHFRGYVHVKPETRLSTDHDARALYPISFYLDQEPNFVVQTNNLPPLYGSSELSAMKLYIINSDTYASESIEIPLSGGAGVREFSDLPFTLADGRYFWTFHQDYNGSNYTAKPATIYNWTFSPIPTTGAALTSSFTIDRVAPTISNSSDVQVVSVLDADTMNVKISTTVNDPTAGISDVKLYLLDNALAPLGTVTVTPSIMNRIPIVFDFFQDLAIGESYNFYTVATDLAGNAATSSVTAFTLPEQSELTLPVLQSWPPEAVTSVSAGLRSNIISTGNSLVTSRGTCWGLSNAEVLSAATGTANCQFATSSTGFGTGIYVNPYTNLPADSAIYYRGFAANSAGVGYSDINSFTTQPSAFATSSSPVPPTVAVAEPYSITADSATLQGNITAVGGDLISQMAICWAVSPASLPTTPAGFGSSCFSWVGSLPTGATLPYNFSYRFSRLPYNSNLAYRVYATNSYGTAYADGTFATQATYNDFAVTNNSYVAIVDRAAKNYDLDVNFYTRDYSNFEYAGRARNVNYQVRLKQLNGTLIETQTGQVPIAIGYVPDTLTEQFFDIPYGAKIVEVEINTGPLFLVEPTSPIDRRANNTFSWVVPFQDPDAITGIITGSGGGTGPSIPDPGFILTMPSTVIRSGEESTLAWDTRVNYPMNCRILGPTTFGINGVYEFDPSINGMTGSTTTGSLTSAQTFELNCIEPITNSTFTTSTRVEVVGKIQES